MVCNHHLATKPRELFGTDDLERDQPQCLQYPKIGAKARADHPLRSAPASLGIRRKEAGSRDGADGEDEPTDTKDCERKTGRENPPRPVSQPEHAATTKSNVARRGPPPPGA